MKDFRSFLRERVVVFDGAFGTLLQARAARIPALPERLNLEDPALIAGIHRDYAAAGADVITANTFGANEAKTGDAALTEELVRAAVRLAREAAPGKFVALDIGPTGHMLEPMGSMTFEQAYGVFARMVEAGKEADVILIETMSDLQELRADFNKSMREFQEQCATRFDQMHDQLHNILLTLWVAIAGAFLTSLGIMASIIFGFPWEKLFALMDWIENGL